MMQKNRRWLLRNRNGEERDRESARQKDRRGEGGWEDMQRNKGIGCEKERGREVNITSGNGQVGKVSGCKGKKRGIETADGTMKRRSECPSASVACMLERVLISCMATDYHADGADGAAEGALNSGGE